MENASGNGKQERPLITPEELIPAEVISQYPLKKLILAFMPLQKIIDYLGPNISGSHPLGEKTEWYRCFIIDDDTVLAGPLWGGPVCSVALEELSVFGVKYVIGCGYSGTLDAGVPPGSMMIADSGLCSDGTTREYTTDTEIYGDEEMLGLVRNTMRNHGIEPYSGRVWTMDAIYYELPSKAAYWKKKGARFVNMETSCFYAVTRAKGIKAAYFSVVSDCLEGEKWSGWHDNLVGPVENMWNICMELSANL
jgi:purine-nucleoside phosphorylase